LIVYGRHLTQGKYSIEECKAGAFAAGPEEVLDRHDNLTVARAIYRGRVEQYPDRVVLHAMQRLR
jgi:hypothetical protein